MITNESSQGESPDIKQEDAAERTNEKIGFYYSTSIKITDPNSGEVIMHIRGD